MAKTTWILKIDGANNDLGNFKTKEEGIDAAFKLISKKFTNISETIDETLKQRHTKACKALINKFKNVENLKTLDFFEVLCKVFDEHGYDMSDTNVHIEENSFMAEMDRGGSTIFSFFFGKTFDDFHLETNMLDEDAKNYFLFVKTQSNDIKYSLYEKKTLPTVANSFLVYQALVSTATPQLRKEIREKIIRKYGGRDSSGYEGSGYEINLSDDTISNQIHALQKLGIPIYERSVSVEDKKNQVALMSIYGDKYKDGYYIDNDRPITPDYSKLKPGSYIMLVYLTLKEVDRAHALPTQQAVIDAVRDKFGITLQRQKVKNYLDLLNDLGAGIKNDKTGYWM